MLRPKKCSIIHRMGILKNVGGDASKPLLLVKSMQMRNKREESVHTTLNKVILSEIISLNLYQMNVFLLPVSS